MRKLTIIAAVMLTACQAKEVGTADTTVVIRDTVSVSKDTLVATPSDTTLVKTDSTKF